MRKQRQRPEEVQQIHLVNWCRLVHLAALPGRLVEYIAHVPNGGWRSAFEAARMKAAGVLPGFPDLECVIAAGGFHALHIEMKHGRNGLTDSQAAMHVRLAACGRKVVICRSWVEGARELKAYLGADAARWPNIQGEL